MNTKRTRFIAGVVTVLLLSPPLAMALTPSLTFTNFRGTLRIVQSVPCGGVVDVTTSIADGRMDLTPMVARRAHGGSRPFDLTRLEMFFTPFTVQHECFGVAATVDFQEIGVQLAGPVSFTGEPIGDGQYRFTIPRSQVLVFESVRNNLPVPQPETAYQRPGEDVTGVIDLRTNTAQLRIVMTSKLRFRAGCIGNRCVIDETGTGRHTVDVSAQIVRPGRDTDSDGVPDLADNCPLVANRSQSPVATPVINAPADISVSSCQAPVIGVAEAVDVCHARPVAISSDAPDRFAIGHNVVTWTGRNGIDAPVSARQNVTVTVDDRIAPVVSCVVDRAGQFTVSAVDDCGGRTSLKLGSFVLANGEVIQIHEGGRPGVRLLGTERADKVRHFQVGKGEAVIVATDAAGNVGRAQCGQPLEAIRR